MYSEREHFFFKLGMAWRIIYGGVRIIIGFLLLHVVNHPFGDLIHLLMHNEVVEDPSDTLAFYLFSFFEHHDFTVTFFFAFYFMFWGMVDILFSLALLRHQLWAFPLSLLLLASFMIYEVARFAYTHSPALIALFCVDLVVGWLIYREWQRLQRRLRVG